MFKPKGVMFLTLAIMLMGFSCSGPESDQPLLTAELPLHLEEHIEAASIKGSEVPVDVPTVVEWRFNEPQPDWKPVVPLRPSVKPIKLKRVEDALHLTLTEDNKHLDHLQGAIYFDLPDWNREDWGYIVIRARTKDDIGSISVCFNLREKAGPTSREQGSFIFDGEYVDVISDGSIKTYVMRADWSWGEWEGPWKQLGILISSKEPAYLDILAISIIPKEADYSQSPAGISTEVRNEAYRRVLYTHIPGKLKYLVKVPEAGRLDFGMGVLREEPPITFRISVSSEEEGSTTQTLFEETYSDKEKWAQRSVDLSSYAKKTVTLSLEADADQGGIVALWAAPTLSGARSTRIPNVILYIIDGASTEYMSVYGYNRRTTPNLERIAKEGIVFENAWSNSTWTKASNPSFMTSLHHSVLGGYKTDTDPLPDQTVTMSQHFHNAAFQTAQFSANPYTGTMSGLEKGVDVLREGYIEPNSRSSEVLHKDFWTWRETYPGEPYFAHFQSYDVHYPRRPVPPFTGLYIAPKLRDRYYEWTEMLLRGRQTQLLGPEVFEKLGINRKSYYDVERGLYDEGMAHNDYQIGKLVKGLKESGEWENTLFIIAADHGWGQIGMMLDLWPQYWYPLCIPYLTQIPLIAIWPGHIEPGHRLSQPVSLIDILPTILDLVRLPQPEIMQGQSFAPLLLGNEGWEPRPVIIEEVNVDWDEGVFKGSIEVINGRWGASLEIDQRSEEKKKETPPERRRPSPLLLYDFWNDPYCMHSLHEERTNLVEKYTKFLQEHWEAHQLLAKLFSRSSEVPLTPAQLRTLRSLGYIK